MTTTDDPRPATETRTQPPPGPNPATITIRPFADADRPFFRRIVERLVPAASVAPRDPARFADWFRRLGAGELEQPPDADTFVAVGAAGEPLGILMIHPEREYFTAYDRAYVQVLVVAPEAEGRGAGQALMRHAETWARARAYPEISLDVFAGNDRAQAFYERLGFRPDHTRLVKRL